MEIENSKVYITVARENRSSYSARKIRIIVDGVEEGTVENGSCIRLAVNPGKHNVDFAIGKCVYSSLAVDAFTDTNISCAAKTTGGIDARIVNRDVVLESCQKKRSPLLLRILIAIPVIIILFVLILQSAGTFLS